uniref:Uncharacterized protein n=1 Tax=Sphaerodactylus townsendi TaxID=933632 RepID=A0ACB8G6J8_9SAUR
MTGVPKCPSPIKEGTVQIKVATLKPLVQVKGYQFPPCPPLCFEVCLSLVVDATINMFHLCVFMHLRGKRLAGCYMVFFSVPSAASAFCAAGKAWWYKCLCVAAAL